MKHKYPRVYRFTLLLVASVLLLPAVQAKQPDRSPGVYIPVLKNAHVDDLTATRWVENAAGGYLEVLEQMIIPSKLERTIIVYVVGEEFEYWINDEVYIRPNDIPHEDFINEMKQKDFVGDKIAVVGTVRPSMEGKR